MLNTLRLTDTNAEFYIGGQMEYLCLMTNKLKNSTLNWQNTYKEDIQKNLQSLFEKNYQCSIYTMLQICPRKALDQSFLKYNCVFRYNKGIFLPYKQWKYPMS